MVLAVLFLGPAFTWDGSGDLLVPGLGIAAVILALSVFLKVTHDGERAKNAHRAGDGAKARDDGEAPLT